MKTRHPARFRVNPNGPEEALTSRNGFTLMEMMITLAVFVILAGAIFTLMSGTLQSASTLQDNQGRSDQLAALFDFVKDKLAGMPARSTLSSYLRGDGEGLVQNGIIFGNTNLATAIDAKVQPNGYYALRLTTYSSNGDSDQAQDARQELSQLVTTDDPSLSWTLLLGDVKTLDWKFQDGTLIQWLDTWTTNNTPNLVELTLQAGGSVQPSTMDFWVPKINPISVRIQANAAASASGGTTPVTPPRRPRPNSNP